MKIRLESVSAGIIICHILEPITKDDAANVLRGITKLLSNGKTRILVHFSPAARQGEVQLDFMEKTLRQQRALAVRLGGDIRYAVSGGSDDLKIAGIFTDLGSALGSFQARSEAVLQAESKLKEKDEQIRRLTEENRRLAEKLKELTELLRKPSTDAELKEAVAHYRALAAEAEKARFS